MRPWAFYHDHDELKCEVIREAIKAKAITDGEVVCGDIKQLAANDVRGFRRVHVFAGGGFWDLALNLAGWGDEPVWTGSCPCPSFSAAGKGAGFDDPRHLWPDWFRLIEQCRPPVVFGEQVGAAIRFGWFDLVQSGMEAAAYAVGKIVFGAHSVGAPHIRQRLYFVADTDYRNGQQLERTRSGSAKTSGWWPFGQPSGRGDSCEPEHATSDGRIERRPEPGGRSVAGGRGAGECADTSDCGRKSVSSRFHAGSNGARVEQARAFAKPCDDDPDTRHSAHADGGQPSDGDVQRGGQHGLFAPDRGIGERSDAEDAEWRRTIGAPDDRRGVAETGGPGTAGDGLHAIGPRSQGHGGDERAWRGPGWLDPQQARSVAEAGATRGFWADCDWWHGRDGKFRPIGSGLQPLAHGSPARVGRLRLYGDAIVVAQAQAFIEAYLTM